MSKSLGNLCECPMFKIEDRRAIAVRLLNALLADPACKFDFKGEWKPLTADEAANWESRQFFVAVIASYPVREPNEQPPSEIELADADPVNQFP